MKAKSTKDKKKKVLPPTKCNFYIADDIRLEHNGKPSLLGLYTDNVIVVHLPSNQKDPTLATPMLMSGISILASFANAKGSYDMTLDLRGPSGQSLGASSSQRLKGNQGTINFIARLSPMPIIGLGQYKLTIALDGKPYEFSFEFRRGDSQMHAASINEMPATILARPAQRKRTP